MLLKEHIEVVYEVGSMELVLMEVFRRGGCTVTENETLPN